jgi:hypothetical protein
MKYSVIPWTCNLRTGLGPGKGSWKEGHGRIMFLRKIKFHVSTITKVLKSTAVILVVHMYK